MPNAWSRKPRRAHITVEDKRLALIAHGWPEVAPGQFLRPSGEGKAISTLTAYRLLEIGTKTNAATAKQVESVEEMKARLKQRRGWA